MTRPKATNSDPTSSIKKGNAQPKPPTKLPKGPSEGSLTPADKEAPEETVRGKVTSSLSSEQAGGMAKRLNAAGDPEQARQFEKVAADTAKYEALAREHGCDLSEEGFNAVLGRVARTKAPAPK